MKEKKRILICERFAVEALVTLKQNSFFEVLSFEENLLAEAHALVIRSKFKIDEVLLQKTPKLELIVTSTSGFDHIDLKATQKRNIKVMYTPEANVVSTAEHAWALLMATVRQVVPAHKMLKAGTWQRDPFVGSELAKKTLGIVGLGRIGQKMAHFARAFDMKVLAFDPYQEEATFVSQQTLRVSYEELLKQSDIVTFHVPATEETAQMLNRSHFEYLHPEMILINVSRGSVIHEDDLAEALLQKKIKAAALDVFQKEPLPRDSKLLKCSNLILTPHLGAFTEEAFLKASLQAAQQIENFYLKNEIVNELPLQNNWGTLSFIEKDKERKSLCQPS